MIKVAMYTCTVYFTCDLVFNSTSESCDKYLMLLNILFVVFYIKLFDIYIMLKYP